MDNAPWEIWREYDDCYRRDGDWSHKTLAKACEVAEVNSRIHAQAVLVVSVNRPWKVMARYENGQRVAYDAQIPE